MLQRVFSPSADDILQLAEKLENDIRYDDAILQYSKAARVLWNHDNTKHDYCLMRLARLQVSMQKYEDAIYTYEKIMFKCTKCLFYLALCRYLTDSQFTLDGLVNTSSEYKILKGILTNKCMPLELITPEFELRHNGSWIITLLLCVKNKLNNN